MNRHVWMGAVLLLACGGSAPPPAKPKTRAEVEPSKTGARTNADEAPRASGIQCNDGSCFACGEAICLSGFFCSVGKGGHGCAWLPSCSGRPSCGCIAPSLREEPGCSCQEKEGGVYVTCDGAKL